ncbi:protein fuzzy homolog isoform X1 [Cylas formicarius]|uniref:protein fuzzy homolog isoform X1 n=1 Tax=Cylas formicarius TaxID=197179 RepID=UPI0029585148|nr:protein fuzzy homolog isoform X1 [Cylas formicarius]
MSAHVICITSGGGLPVFSRKKGSCENLPFSTIGSLNGVHMFGKPLNIELLNTLTNDYSVAWKEFRESLVIIGIASGCSIEVLYQLLQLVFDAIVLIIGIDEIKNQRNIDRIKRELRICYPLIDRLLDILDCGDSSNKHSSDIVGFVETIMSTENHLLQVVLDSFAESVDSMYSCLLIGGKIAVATESYWSLNPHELRLLSLLAVAETNEKSKDVPVFLPYKSSTVAFRFVACSIMPDIQVCCLCGSTPSLKDIEYSAAQCFKNSMDILKSAEQVSPRHFPNSFVIDGGILGLLLINITLKKYMMSKNPQPNSSRKTTSSSHRLDILRTFFYQSVMKFLIPKLEIETNLIPSDKSSLDDQNEGIESYWCSEYHKCHAIRVNDNILCVLYNSSTPTHAMRLITKKTLSLLISDKQTCW